MVAAFRGIAAGFVKKKGTKMTRRTLISLILMSGFCLMNACDSAVVPAGLESDFGESELPVVNGTKVDANDRLSTVALVLIQGGQLAGTFCTGTLISPNYVLTAGHCIADCEGEESNIEKRPYMYVGIGYDERALDEVFPIEEFYVHPQFECSPSLKNDIGLVKLKKPVPLSTVTPTPALPVELAITAGEVDSSGGVQVTSVGFGKTVALKDESKGKKNETTRSVYAVCPLSGTGSKYCTQASANIDKTYTAKKGILYLDASDSATCTGDSGGPTFITRNGREFVAGVTSYGYTNCTIVNGMTLVTDYYDFIQDTVDVVAAATAEDCSNEVDDNGDSLIDCDDPYCFGEKKCFQEICNNKVDDNGDGLIDCADPACQNDESCIHECSSTIVVNGNRYIDCSDPICASTQYCQPEDCTNGVDDNENGYVDCDDPLCFEQNVCKIENCTNGMDDNGNGLIDCADPGCVNELTCKTEICNDDIDNNANGLIDCEEESCQNEIYCQIENCTNGQDDNGNGMIDCFDPACKSETVCQPEICTNGMDDNGNGLIDCAEPSCSINIVCQPEICDDGKDNNGNGLIDCDDPGCENACNDGGGCSVSSHHSSPFAALLVLFAAPAIILRRRKQP